MPLSFRYLIGGAAQPVVPGSPLWQSPLPVDRHHFQNDGDRGAGRIGITHGDYFSAVRRFFVEEGFSILSTAFASGPSQSPADIDICLMKHGEYYHPSKVTVGDDGNRRSFVLNVAVSDPGHRIIDTEIAALRRLGEVSGPSAIPSIYGQGSVAMDDGRTVRMFLGEWFEGYHEFHLSANDPQVVCVWGERDVPSPISREAAYLLYHQAASILTRYYNPSTTEHISRWHHAAGDFIVRRRDDQVDVRLITVRHYSPLLRMAEVPDDAAEAREQALAGLLIFFIRLSIRMRLDRLEGIGEMAWADDTAVIGTWSGFLDGLSKNCFPASFLPDPVQQFERYLAACGEADFRELAGDMAAALPAAPAEKILIERQLPSHVQMLLETICRIGFP